MKLQDGIFFALLALPGGVTQAAAFYFSTGNPDGQMAAASRAPGALVEIEAADDFVLTTDTDIQSATFTGLLPSGAPASSITQVAVEIYRVFPQDSGPASGAVPTRTNSPSDVAYTARDSADNSLNFSFSVLNANFSASNSVLNGINPIPNQRTAGEGGVSGEEGVASVTFPTPIVLPPGHYFFVAQLNSSSGNFYWLSAPKPIVAPGAPFASDLQAWIRNANLDPDWLRIGTDIVGGASPPQFNLAFSISGNEDHIFASGFGG